MKVYMTDTTVQTNTVTLTVDEFNRLSANQKTAKPSASAARLDADYKNWDALPPAVIATMLGQRPTMKLKAYAQSRFAGELDKFMAKKAAIGVVAPYALHVAGFAIGSKINHDLAEKAKTHANGLAGFVQFAETVQTAFTAFLMDHAKAVKLDKNGNALGVYGAFEKLQLWIDGFNALHADKLQESTTVAPSLKIEPAKSTIKPLEDALV